MIDPLKLVPEGSVFDSAAAGFVPLAADSGAFCTWATFPAVSSTVTLWELLSTMTTRFGSSTLVLPSARR
jgi:hypothetical protein